MVEAKHLQYQNTSQQGHFDDDSEVFFSSYLSLSSYEGCAKVECRLQFTFFPFFSFFPSFCNVNKRNMTQEIIENKENNGRKVIAYSVI